MLIIVNEFNYDILKQNVQCLAAIENILAAFALKKHIVIMPKPLIKFVIDSSEFGLLAKHRASVLLESVREFASLVHELDHYVEIDFENSETSQLYIMAGKQIRKIGCGNILDPATLESTILLGEDELDSKIYDKITKFYINSSSSLRQLTTSAIHDHGGGSRTYDIYKNIKTNNKLCLCLLDNDKKHPKYKLGNTAKRFNNENHDNCYCDYKILDIHEIECLFPVKLIQKTVTNQSDNSEKIFTLDWLEQLSAENISYKYFFDHKKGLVISDALSIDSKYGEFWLQQTSDAYRKLNNCEVECIVGECDNHSHCVNLSGFGDGLAKSTLDVLDTTSHMKISEMLCSDLSEKWDEIGKFIFNWTCAPSRKIVSS